MLQRRVRDAIVIGLVGVAEHALDHRAQVVKEVLREHKGRGETVQARSDVRARATHGRANAWPMGEQEGGHSRGWMGSGSSRAASASGRTLMATPRAAGRTL